MSDGCQYLLPWQLLHNIHLNTWEQCKKWPYASRDYHLNVFVKLCAQSYSRKLYSFHNWHILNLKVLHLSILKSLKFKTEELLPFDHVFKELKMGPVCPHSLYLQAGRSVKFKFNEMRALEIRRMVHHQMLEAMRQAANYVFMCAMHAYIYLIVCSRDCFWL